jgi:hypothetical protein
MKDLERRGYAKEVLKIEIPPRKEWREHYLPPFEGEVFLKEGGLPKWTRHWHIYVDVNYVSDENSNIFWLGHCLGWDEEAVQKFFSCQKKVLSKKRWTLEERKRLEKFFSTLLLGLEKCRKSRRK